jgi:enoyl-CoA hydratase
MRYCTNDTYFTIKEIDMGMVADLGTLQRLPKLINPSVARELAFTGRAVAGIEAQQIGLVNKAFESREELDKYVWEIATQIASKSPVAIRGTKHILNYSLEHSTKDSLEYMATWNAAMLLSNDLQEAFLAQTQKRSAKFED